MESSKATLKEFSFPSTKEQPAKTSQEITKSERFIPKRVKTPLPRPPSALRQDSINRPPSVSATNTTSQIIMLKKHLETLDKETKSLRDKFSYSANNLTADQAAEKKIIKQQSEEPTFIEELPLHDAFQLLKSKYSVMQKKHVGERHELQVKFDELQKEHHIQLDKTRILEERVKLLKADLDETKQARLDWKNEKTDNYVSLKKDYDIARSKYDALNKRYEQLITESQSMCQSYEEQLHVNEALKKDFQDAKTQISNYQLEMKQSHDIQKKETIKLSSNGYEEQISLLKTQLDSMHKAFAQLETSHRSLQSDFASLESILAKTKTDLEVERNQVGEWTQKFRKSEMENDRLKAELKSVSAKIQNWESLNSDNREKVSQFLQSLVPAPLPKAHSTINAQASNSNIQPNNAAPEQEQTAKEPAVPSALLRVKKEHSQANMGSGKVSNNALGHSKILIKEGSFRDSKASAVDLNNGSKRDHLASTNGLVKSKASMVNLLIGNIPVELQPIIEADPILKVLAMLIQEKNHHIHVLDEEIKSRTESQDHITKQYYHTRELNKKQLETIEALKAKIDGLNYEQAGLQENLSTISHAFKKLEEEKVVADTDLARLKVNESQWTRDKAEIHKLNVRVQELERALKKVEQWKRIVGENERLGKEVVGLVRHISAGGNTELGVETTSVNANVPEETVGIPIGHHHDDGEMGSSLEFALGDFLNNEDSDIEIAGDTH